MSVVFSDAGVAQFSDLASLLEMSDNDPAILWAQLLSMRLRKGTAVRGSAIFSSVTGMFFYAVFAFFGWIFMELFSSAEGRHIFCRCSRASCCS